MLRNNNIENYPYFSLKRSEGIRQTESILWDFMKGFKILSITF